MKTQTEQIENFLFVLGIVTSRGELRWYTDSWELETRNNGCYTGNSVEHLSAHFTVGDEDWKDFEEVMTSLPLEHISAVFSADGLETDDGPVDLSIGLIEALLT